MCKLGALVFNIVYSVALGLLLGLLDELTGVRGAADIDADTAGLAGTAGVLADGLEVSVGCPPSCPPSCLAPPTSSASLAAVPKGDVVPPSPCSFGGRVRLAYF